MDSENTEEKIYPQGYEPQETPDTTDHDVRNHLLDFILKSGPTEVIDTDIGIKKEDQDRIFEIFAKVHMSEAMKEKGTGVGLYLSKKLIETLSGRLWLKQSDKDKGSTFCFSLSIFKS